MNINIDLKLLKEKNLTPNEYVYLVLAYEDKMCNFDVDLNKLEELKFVKLVGDKVIIRKYNITQLMTHQEFNTESKSQDKTPVNGFEDSWEKLLELYPKKEGTRALQNKVT